MNWEIQKFSQIMTISKGEAITKATENDGIYPVILGGQEPAYYIDRFNHVGKAIVVSRSGASAGYVSFWNEPIFITDGFLIEPQNTNYHFEFIFYLLKFYRKVLRDLQNGSAIPHVTPKTIYSLKAPIPPLKEQKRIASILSVYDNLIEVNNKRIKVLEQMAENLYKEWFVRFRFPGHETAKFENGLPKGWNISKLGDISQIKAGGDRPGICSETPTNMITVPIFSNGIDKEGLYGYTNEPEIEEESVTISARGTVGFVCLRCVPYVPIVRLIAIIPSKSILTALYLFYYLQKDSIVANGTSQQQITVPMVSKKRIIIPPLHLLIEFEKFEKPLWDKMDSIRKLNSNLVKQRDLLLPRLMSGKLEV